MVYVTQSIVDADNGGLHALVARIIAEKVQSIITNITNVDNHGCLGKVTGMAWHWSESIPLGAGWMLENALLSELLADTSGALVILTAVQWKRTAISDLRRND